MKPQRVRYKLGQAIEKPCTDILAYPRKCVKVLRRMNGCLATKDNRDSWGMYVTSTECRTVITAVLMVMSGIDPHTIRDLNSYGWDVGSMVSLVFRSNCRS
jgi:hypothetical protein